MVGLSVKGFGNPPDLLLPLSHAPKAFLRKLPSLLPQCPLFIYYYFLSTAVLEKARRKVLMRDPRRLDRYQWRSHDTIFTVCYRTFEVPRPQELVNYLYLHSCSFELDMQTVFVCGVFLLKGRR